MKQPIVKHRSSFLPGIQERKVIGYHWISENRMLKTKPAKNDLLGVTILNTDGSEGAIFACDVLNFDELPENLLP